MKGARFNPKLTTEGMTTLLGLDREKNYELLFSPTELFAATYAYRPHPSGKGSGYSIINAIHVTVKPDGSYNTVVVPGGSYRFQTFISYLGGAPIVDWPMEKRKNGAKAYYTAPTPSIVKTPSEGQMMEFVRVFESDGKVPLPADISKYVLAPMLIGKPISPSDERAGEIETKISDVIAKGMEYVKKYNEFADNQNRSVKSPDSGIREKDVKRVHEEYLEANEVLDSLFETDAEKKVQEAKRLAARKERESRKMPEPSGSSSSSSPSAPLPSLLASTTSSSSSSAAPQGGRRKKTKRGSKKRRTTRRR